MDFGIARLKEERGMTAEGTVVGTPDYMSPEQARGVALDFRSDIYSTGVVLYEVFTGTLPFDGDTPLAVVLKHIQENPPSPQTRNPKIDPKISQIILKCMQKDPRDRFQSVNDLYEALTRVTAVGVRRAPAALACLAFGLAALLTGARRVGAGRAAVLRGAEGEAPLHLPVGLPRPVRQHQPPPVLPEHQPRALRGSARRSASRRRPNFQLGVRGVFNYGTEPNIDNALYQDNYVSRGAYVDRYFLLWTPGAWTVQAGALRAAGRGQRDALGQVRHPDARRRGLVRRAPRPDVHPDVHARPASTAPQRYRDESILGVGQVLWNSGDESRFAVQASASFWNMDMRNVDPQYYRENRVVVQDGQLAYQSKFQLVDLLVKLQFPVARLPVTLSLDFIHNFGAPGKIANAYEAGVTVGNVGTPKTWRAFFIYQYIGRDALVGAYNTDDWWWHTWAEGYRFGVSYTILPMIYVQPAVVFQRRLDYDFWINRVTVDLVKMF